MATKYTQANFREFPRHIKNMSGPPYRTYVAVADAIKSEMYGVPLPAHMFALSEEEQRHMDKEVVRWRSLGDATAGLFPRRSLGDRSFVDLNIGSLGDITYRGFTPTRFGSGVIKASRVRKAVGLLKNAYRTLPAGTYTGDEYDFGKPELKSLTAAVWGLFALECLAQSVVNDSLCGKYIPKTVIVEPVDIAPGNTPAKLRAPMSTEYLAIPMANRLFAPRGMVACRDDFFEFGEAFPHWLTREVMKNGKPAWELALFTGGSLYDENNFIYMGSGVGTVVDSHDRIMDRVLQETSTLLLNLDDVALIRKRVFDAKYYKLLPVKMSKVEQLRFFGVLYAELVHRVTQDSSLQSDHALMKAVFWTIATQVVRNPADFIKELKNDE